MAVLPAADASLTTSGYVLSIADDLSQVEAAQRLRHLVFTGELGATGSPDSAVLDRDAFDPYCDHLLVRQVSTGEVVGTYRLLPPGRTVRRYAEDEFELTALRPLGSQLVEAGRACVHPDHRTGAVINLMWAGIARYLHLRGLRWLGGCASVPVADGGLAAAEMWAQARARHLAPPLLRVRPRRPWFAEPGVPTEPVAGATTTVPPLLRGYLRLGAWICGEPAYDPDFKVADFYVLLSMDRMNPRYLRHFLGGRP